MPWYLTFSHEQNSWLARCPGIPWTPVSAAWARDAFDRGYIVLDAI